MGIRVPLLMIFTQDDTDYKNTLGTSLWNIMFAAGKVMIVQPPSRQDVIFQGIPQESLAYQISLGALCALAVIFSRS
jgi:hypothetical protein